MNANTFLVVFYISFCPFQYLNTAEFAMREELSLKAAILAEKFAPDLSW